MESKKQSDKEIKEMSDVGHQETQEATNDTSVAAPSKRDDADYHADDSKRSESGEPQKDEVDPPSRVYSNVGMRMLLKMGYRGGGLGKDGQGIRAPIIPASTCANCRDIGDYKGLGYQDQPSESGEPQKDLVDLPSRVYSNVGMRMLLKMGYRGGGLGKDGQGIRAPIIPASIYASCRDIGDYKGLGYEAQPSESGEPQKDVVDLPSRGAPNVGMRTLHNMDHKDSGLGKKGQGTLEPIIPANDCANCHDSD